MKGMHGKGECADPKPANLQGGTGMGNESIKKER